MASWFQLDWHKMFAIDVPILEIVIRGSLTYLALFTLLRVVLKRQAGTVGITDVLVLVLIADAAQNGMAGSYQSITEGIILVATIIFWSYALDWLGYHFPVFQRFFRPPPLPLVRDGKLLRHNMRHELVTYDELMSMLRQEGVRDLVEVELAAMEGDGHISVIKRNGQKD